MSQSAQTVPGLLVRMTKGSCVSGKPSWVAKSNAGHSTRKSARWSGVHEWTSAFSWSERKWFYFRAPSWLSETIVREERLHCFVPPNLPPAILSATRALLNPANLPPAPETASQVKWVNSPSAPAPALDASLLSLDLPPSSGLAKHIAWHRKGDYFATVCKSFLFLGPSSVFCANNHHSQWRRAGCGMDSSTFAPTFSGPIQEDQGFSADCLVPSIKAPLLCRSLWLRSSLLFLTFKLVTFDRHNAMSGYITWPSRSS